MRKLLQSMLATILAFGSLLLIPAAPAVAAVDVCTWTGANSADWSDGGNWSCSIDGAAVPENNDSLVFPAGAATATNNDIVGTLTLNQVDVSGDNYLITGNPIEITGYLQFTGVGNNFNMSDLTFANASTGTSLVINGTGNTITNGIGLNMAGGDDFNIYTNVDFTSPHFTGGSIGNFNKWGTGTLTSSTSASTYTASGAVNVLEGQFVCNNANCGGASANDIQTQSTGALVLDGANIAVVNHDIILDSSTSPQLNMLPGSVTINSNLTVNSTGTIYAQPGTLIVSGLTYLYSDAYFLGSTATTSNILINGNIDPGSTGDVYVDNVFAGVSGNNATYNGNFTAVSGAVINPRSATALGNTTGTTTIQSGASLYTDSLLTIAEPLIIEGTGEGSGIYTGAVVNDTTDVAYNGAVSLTGDTTLRSISGGELYFGGVVSGTADLMIIGDGTSVVGFEGAGSNTYVGTTTATTIGTFYLTKSGGAVSVTGNLNVLATPTNDTQVHVNLTDQIADTSTVTLTNNVNTAILSFDSSDTLGMIKGNGEVIVTSSVDISVGANNSSGTYSGQFTIGAPAGNIHKVGTGTWIVTGTSSGPASIPTFVVDAGVLQINSALTTSPVSVNSTGILKGTGQTGATTINTGATFAAGTSPGCMTVASLTLGAGSVFEQEIAGGTACTEYDQTTVTGDASLGGATLTTLPTYTPTPGTVFTILRANTISGTFNDLANGATFTANGIQFRINYNTSEQGNHTVTLTVLGGTLVPTGQNHNGVAYLAFGVLLLGLGGMYFALRRNKFSIKRSTI